MIKKNQDLSSRLNKKIIVEKPDKKFDDSGSYIITWNNILETFAEIKPLRGDKIFESGRLQGYVTHQITTRYTPEITAEMRIKYNKRIFYIDSIIDVFENSTQFNIIVKEEI